MVKVKKKYVYESYKAIQIIDSQCEVFIYYNAGKYSEICPKEKIDKIKRNIIPCEKKRIPNILD